MAETVDDRARIHILVADDDPSLRLALTLTFERRGHRVQAVPDTDAARAVLAHGLPDAVLVDAGMPRDGVALWRDCLEGPERPAAALLLTGDVAALGDLAHHPLVMAKPFAFGGLVERVEAMVAAATSERGPQPPA